MYYIILIFFLNVINHYNCTYPKEILYLENTSQLLLKFNNDLKIFINMIHP
jgi:hypothetical protein